MRMQSEKDSAITPLPTAGRTTSTQGMGAQPQMDAHRRLLVLRGQEAHPSTRQTSTFSYGTRHRKWLPAEHDTNHLDAQEILLLPLSQQQEPHLVGRLLRSHCTMKVTSITLRDAPAQPGRMQTGRIAGSLPGEDPELEREEPDDTFTYLGYKSDPNLLSALTQQASRRTADN
jgi:hypothetical protein